MLLVTTGKSKIVPIKTGYLYLRESFGTVQDVNEMQSEQNIKESFNLKGQEKSNEESDRDLLDQMLHHIIILPWRSEEKKKK